MSMHMHTFLDTDATQRHRCHTDVTGALAQIITRRYRGMDFTQRPYRCHTEAQRHRCHVRAQMSLVSKNKGTDVTHTSLAHEHSCHTKAQLSHKCHTEAQRRRWQRQKQNLSRTDAMEAMDGTEAQVAEADKIVPLLSTVVTDDANRTLLSTDVTRRHRSAGAAQARTASQARTPQIGRMVQFRHTWQRHRCHTQAQKRKCRAGKNSLSSTCITDGADS
eukprot:scaffold77608_cov23-Tisochrysis_lutea.AAC.2